MSDATELEQLREKVRLLRECMEIKEKIEKMGDDHGRQSPFFPVWPPYQGPYYTPWSFNGY